VCWCSKFLCRHLQYSLIKTLIPMKCVDTLFF
jgi:hypothetical protein